MYKSFLIVMILAIATSCTKPTPKLISKLDQALTLKVGEQANLELQSHGSVGIEHKVSIQNPKILGQSKTFKYDNKARAKMPGGDSGKNIYTFTALQQGETSIIIKEYFRGDLKSQNKIKVTVD